MELTVGELLARRRLKQDTLGGVERYIPGQHSATMIGDQAILSYVDGTGFVCIVPCHFVDDEWITYAYVVRCGLLTVDSRFMGRPQPLSEASVRALQAAVKKAEEKKPKKKTTQKEGATPIPEATPSSTTPSEES